MDFGSGGNQAAKAWKDIWGSGQGIGAVHMIESVAERVERLKAEYAAAKAELLQKWG
jgi:nitronate monooxygenase